jgi:adenosylhomocysteine nucleosidase
VTVNAQVRRLGLIAVQREALPLLGKLQEEEHAHWGDIVLRAGAIQGCPVALAEVLPGPVNAALGAQALVVQHGVEALICFGSAGAVGPNLRPGDLVIARRAVAHDAGVFLGQRYEPSGLMGRDERGRVGHRRGFDADPALVTLALSAAQSIGGAVCAGTVATGNQVVFSAGRKRWLHQTFGALVVEMETAAVAQVAAAYGLPWVAVRSVSDDAGEELTLDYSRLGACLDDSRPAWRRWMGRWSYLVSRPQVLRRLHRLQLGLDVAARRSAQVVEVMLQRAESWPGGQPQDQPPGYGVSVTFRSVRLSKR